MTEHQQLFPSFFMSGFECSTFRWKDQGRRDLLEETQHRTYALEDYQLLHTIGILVVREGVPWPMVENEEGYDFSAIDPMIAAMGRYGIVPIWDLCHYGYPDDLNPFSEAFVERFARYCRAAAEYIAPRLPGPYVFTPINEISFFADCGGAWGWIAPYGKDVETRRRLRLALCRAAIAGVRAIREVLPEARMVHVDPLVQVLPPPGRPDLAALARHVTFVDTFYAWDVLAGKRHPELGGSPEVLDIVGANYYPFGRMEYAGIGPHKALSRISSEVVPFWQLLEHTWRNYRRPIIIAETGALGEERPAWLNEMMIETLAATNKGIDIQGICLFPAVDMPNWHSGEWLRLGLYDVLLDGGGRLRRVPYQPYINELRRWQGVLEQQAVGAG